MPFGLVFCFTLLFGHFVLLLAMHDIYLVYKAVRNSNWNNVV